jgi:hypothetical protein
LRSAVFFLSAAILLQEVCLLRVLAQAYWHHAASLVIAVALLGFGVAGTLLALKPRLRHVDTLPSCAMLYAVFLPATLLLAGLIDFNVLEVGWAPSQWARLLALEAVFFVPFAVGALGIASALALHAERPGMVYAANLVGSGVGALAAPILLNLGPPEFALGFAPPAAALAAAILLRGKQRLASVAILLVLAWCGVPGLPMSPFKSFQSAPDKTVEETRYGPMGRVDRASVPSLHHAPGLSLTAPEYPSDQAGIYLDGDLVAVLDRGGTNYREHTVDHLSRLLRRVPAIRLGLGPAVDRDASVIESNGDLLAAAGFETEAEAPRAHVRGWDIGLGPGYFHSVPDGHTAAVTPLLTIEAMREALTGTEDSVAFACDLATPPRAGLKLILTAEAVTPHVVAARSADRLCVVLLQRAPDETQREQVLAFCEREGFDVVRPLAWRSGEPFHETRTPLLAPGPDYPYDVRPATDARPFFFKFFRWSRLGDLFENERISFVEWSFVTLIVAFLQVTLLAVALMIGPVLLSRAARSPALLFLALGIGFMLLEMAFLQRAILRIGSPVGAAAAVIGGFLIGSGLGSYLGEKFGRPRRWAALIILAFAPLGYWILPPDALGVALLCGIVAIPMGVPFPAALAKAQPRSVPWALAWNGCGSVAAAAGAPLLSMSFGIPVTLGGALALYLFVAAVRD